MKYERFLCNKLYFRLDFLVFPELQLFISGRFPRQILYFVRCAVILLWSWCEMDQLAPMQGLQLYTSTIWQLFHSGEFQRFRNDSCGAIFSTENIPSCIFATSLQHSKKNRDASHYRQSLVWRRILFLFIRMENNKRSKSETRIFAQSSLIGHFSTNDKQANFIFGNWYISNWSLWFVRHIGHITNCYWRLLRSTELKYTCAKAKIVTAFKTSFVILSICFSSNFAKFAYFGIIYTVESLPFIGNTRQKGDSMSNILRSPIIFIVLSHVLTTRSELIWTANNSFLWHFQHGNREKEVFCITFLFGQIGNMLVVTFHHPV